MRCARSHRTSSTPARRPEPSGGACVPVGVELRIDRGRCRQQRGQAVIVERRVLGTGLREDLRRKRIVTCAEAMAERDGRWLMSGGLVLVRQRPGSAKGVMFMTLEDETGIINAVIWPKVFERQRRLVLSSSMLAINGKIQREGDVVHLVAQRLFDLSEDLGQLGERGDPFPLPHGRGDEFAHGNGAPDPRERPKAAAPTRDIFVPDLLIDRLKVKSRNFH